MKRKTILVVFVSIIVALAVLSLVRIHQTQRSGAFGSERVGVEFVTIAIGEAVVQAEVARTYTDRTKGLSGRAGLGEDEGLLFIFPVADIHGFWMKDMRFPIDIIWLDGDATVVHIKESARPEEYPQKYIPEVPAQYVLEVRSGYSKENEIKIGSQATIIKP